jgi:hypothetical protein
VTVGSDANGNTYAYQYMHLTAAFVARGEQLTADTWVGLTGTSGNAINLPLSEAHLHLHIERNGRTISPFDFTGNPCPQGISNFGSTGGGNVGLGGGNLAGPGGGGGAIAPWWNLYWQWLQIQIPPGPPREIPEMWVARQ